jgi:hypothetical protein
MGTRLPATLSEVSFVLAAGTYIHPLAREGRILDGGGPTDNQHA